MKLSKETIEILRNFASINQHLIINPGKKISTINGNKTALIEYEGADEFDKKVSIYNLGELLAVMKEFSEPELILEDKNLIVKQGKQQVKFMYADESILIAPRKEIMMPSVDITVNITNEMLSRMQKMSSILDVDDFAIIGDGEKVSAKVFSKKNSTENSFEIDLDVANTNVFQINFIADKLRLVPSDYTVEISKKKLSKWNANSLKLVAYIAVEADSVF